MVAAAPATRPRRLPGVAFVTQAPPPGDVLPRMDIAAFTGFAATGPVDIPVAVSDPAHFTEVYGTAPELLVNAASGAPVHAYLADAVAAFFRSGGRRCWVVRVAGRAGNGAPAVRGLVPVPGLAWIGTDNVPAQADFPARSVGSWPDALSVSAGLLSTPIAVSAVSVSPPGASGPPVNCQCSGPVRPTAGDLVRLTLAEDTQLLFAVAAVEGSSVGGTGPLWLSTAPLGASQSGTMPIGGTDVAVTVAEAGPGRVSVKAAVPVGQAPATGSLVRLNLTSGPALLFVAAASTDPALTVLEGWLYRPTAAPATPPAVVAAEILTFQISARSGTDRLDVVRGLGFAPGHARHAGLLPADEELYASLPTSDDPRPRAVPDLWAEVTSPRFPLAGPRGLMLYPIGMDALDDPPFVPARRDSRPRLTRDGLSSFGPALFLDRELADTGTAALAATASYIRDAAPDPRPLTGIHALLGIDEVTITAVPDAVHAGWLPVPPTPAPQPPPHQPYIQVVECPPPAGSPFEGCLTETLSPPAHLTATADPLGNIQVRWDPVAAPAASYVLEETADPLSWSAAREIYQATDTEVTVFGRPPGTYSYRVRAQDGGAASDWSDGACVAVIAGEPWTLGSDTSTVVTVQQALLRMCAARGDMFAALAAPGNYRDTEIAGHAGLLRADPLADLRTPTFGALYHPWLVSVSSVLPSIPPDGAAAGLLAGTALTRGCWVAPANQPLPDVVALAPVIGPAAYQRVQDSGVNLVRQEPRGFCWLSADTLAGDETDPELIEINVRRLLSLLARSARENGPDYVFEPLDDTLRRRIRRRFEEICGILLARGAFAGATPDESFRVAVSSPPNTAMTAADGQLIIELKVAPSVPLRFLTVRLVASGPGTISASGD